MLISGMVYTKIPMVSFTKKAAGFFAKTKTGGFFYSHDTTDFSALCALEILKTFEIAHFSLKNGSFSCFFGSSRHAFSCKHESMSI